MELDGWLMMSEKEREDEDGGGDEGENDVRGVGKEGERERAGEDEIRRVGGDQDDRGCGRSRRSTDVVTF